MYYNDAQAAILVYDITKQKSYEGLKSWQKELAERGPKGVQIAIVGNKEDLAESEEVDMIEAKQFAESIGAVYRKTSAKTSFGVDQLFMDIAAKVTPLSTVIKDSTTKRLQDKKQRSSKVKKKCC